MRRFLPFLALSLFPAVASADEIDDAMLVMVDAANSAYGGTPVNASATKRLRPSTIEAQLRKMATKLELRNCLVGADQWVAGSYGGGTVAGSHEAGDLLNGAFTITPNVFSFDLHDTGVTVGDELGRFRQGKLVAHRSDDGYVAGRFVRTAGRNGVFLAFQDSCADPALALEPWYGASLADWPESAPPPQLLAFYDFDGNLDDQTANAPTLSLVGGASLTAGGGGFSGATGDQALDLGTPLNGMRADAPAGPHFAALAANNEVAVSWWQNSIAVSTTNSFGFEAPGASHALSVHATWSDNVFYFDHGDCCSPPTRVTLPPGPIVLNTWQHIVVQKDAAGLREIYIDGVHQTSVGGGAPLPNYTGGFAIGTFYNGSNSFGGRIDDFALFAEPLSSDQIQVLAAGGSPLDL